MRAGPVAALCLVLAGLLAAPAHGGGGSSIDVQISAHLRSDYRFAYDYVDRVNDSECPMTYKTSSRVVADMTTVRPARFRITRRRARGRSSYSFAKVHGGPGRPADLSIDMKTEMTRESTGGAETPCTGYQPYPTDRCGTRSWALDGRPSMPFAGTLLISPHLTAYPSIQATMADGEWRRGGCGYDTTAADEFATSTDNERGEVKPPYTAPISVRRLFRPGRRTLRLRDTHSFTSGNPSRFGGGSTEVRTVEVTIRKLR